MITLYAWLLLPSSQPEIIPGKTPGLRSLVLPPTSVLLISCCKAFFNKAHQSTASGAFLSNIIKTRKSSEVELRMLGQLADTSLWMDVDRPNDEMDADKYFSLPAK